MKWALFDGIASVYLPVLRVGVKVDSELLVGVGKLAKLVLLVLGDGKEERVVQEVTGLADFAIREVMLELINAGLLMREDDVDRIELTDLGERYYSIINRVLAFNENRHLLLIDQVDGEVIEEAGLLLTRTEAFRRGYVISSQLPRVFLYNRNPLQLRPFLVERGMIEGEQEDAASLFVEVDGIEELFHERNMITLPVEPNATEWIWVPDAQRTMEDVPDNSQRIADLPLCRTYKRFTCQVSSGELKPYRQKLPALLQLREQAPELLSARAYELLQMYDQEQVLCRRAFYLDEQLGLIYESLTFDAQQEQRAVELPVRYSIKDIDQEQVFSTFHLEEQGDWNVQFVELKTVTKVVRVPSNLVVEGLSGRLF